MVEFSTGVRIYATELRAASEALAAICWVRVSNRPAAPISTARCLEAMDDGRSRSARHMCSS